ncbi:hypothetical protein RHMOL_Rhmol06G0288300 [Rhododendron molle]|uniref:Uncharacterized protein n=1 Tax=Rhododendron molle TaxID=49168 RepID=A0ACC0NHP0_RHOML|nr:hypothetical protein RHMOL_Rhmol06G0288300 [Rhododendron molle]
MALTSIPTVLLTASKAPVPVVQRRPASVFHPSVWGDHFLAYASADMKVDINMKRYHQQLKEKVRKQLVEAKGEPSQPLELIDAIQRLGVAYHFETEIEKILHHIYETDHQSAQNNFEQERGHAASAIECYMKQYGATEKEAVAEFQKQVTSAWKDNNSECLRPTAVPMPVLLRVFNVARTFHIVYKDADSYTHSGAKFKEIVTSRELSEITRCWKDLDFADKTTFCKG